MWDHLPQSQGFYRDSYATSVKKGDSFLSRKNRCKKQLVLILVTKRPAAGHGLNSLAAPFAKGPKVEDGQSS